MRKFYIKTYGCQMNVRDTEAITQSLCSQHFTVVDNEKDADIILFNTCSVRDQAERKAMGKIGITSKLKKKKPNLVIGVFGCMAQSKQEEILDKCGHVDLVVGTDQLHKLPQLLEQVISKKVRINETQIDEHLNGLNLHTPGQISAYISIMRGCNQYCSYCIVPYTRGKEKSRSISEIIEEIKPLVGNGVKEIYLLGQNVNAYGISEAKREKIYTKGMSKFAELLFEVNEISGVERIRFTSPHPKYFNDTFLNAISSLNAVCESFHIPLQSGSDRILKLMRRGYTSSEYLQWILKIKKLIPEVTLSSDLIVGFPGETNDDFQKTRNLIKQIEFDNAYIFKYSPRKNTPAADMPNQLSQEIKELRHSLLLNDLSECVAKINKKYLNTTQEILVEGPSKRNSERWSGRTKTNKIVIFSPKPEIKVGDLASFLISRVTASSLFAP